MIPEDQLIPAGGVVLHAPLDVPGQHVRLRHGPAAQVVLKADHFSVPHLPDLVGPAGHQIVLPALAPPSVYQQVKPVPNPGRQHLLQIGGAHAVPGLQVGAAHIDHNGGGVPPVSQQLGVLLPGPLRHGGVQPPDVGRTVPAGGHAAAPQPAEQLGPVRAGNRSPLVGLLLALGRGLGSGALPAQEGGKPPAAPPAAGGSASRRPLCPRFPGCRRRSPARRRSARQRNPPARFPGRPPACIPSCPAR